MTRINCIPVEYLTDAHLLAEYREMLRLRHAKHDKRVLPSTYRLGKGHLKFFYNKGKFLLKRHAALRTEMKRRGFKVNYELDLSSWPSWAMHDWTPTTDAKLLNMARVLRRTVEARN